MKILIVDDEEEARSLIRYYLEETKLDQCVILEASSGTDVPDLLKDNTIDLLFLDVQMPGATGIEVLEGTKKEKLPAIIFTTAFDEYALTAFEYDAVDYLLKPFDSTRFQRAFNKAVYYIEFIKSKRKEDCLTNIVVRSGAKTDIVPIGEVLFFRGDGIYIQVVTKEKTFLYSEKPLYELQALLPPAQFLRVHKSYIVNFHYVRRIKSLLNGDYTIVLKNNQEIKASRTYKDLLKEKLQSGK